VETWSRATIKSQLRQLSTQRCWRHGPNCAYDLCIHLLPPHLKGGEGGGGGEDRHVVEFLVHIGIKKRGKCKKMKNN